MRKLIIILLALCASPSYAAIALVGASSCESAYGSGLSTLDVTPHASTSEGDLVLLVVAASVEGSTTPATATGYTQWAYDDHQSGAPDRQLTVLYKEAGASEGTITVNSPSDDFSAVAVTLSGVDDTTPIDVTFSDTSHVTQVNDNPNPTPASITTVTDDAWVLVVTGMNFDFLSATSHSSGYTALAECYEFAAFQSNVLLVTAMELATAGSESPGGTSHTTTNGGEDTQVFTLAARPAAEGGGSGSPLRRRRD